MPCKKFKCVNCGFIFERLLEKPVNESICLKCNDQAVSYFGEVADSIITEKTSQYFDKNLKVGWKEEKQKRNTEHMRNHEMHGIIAKHGIHTLKNHPLIKDGRIRKADE